MPKFIKAIEFQASLAQDTAAFADIAGKWRIGGAVDSSQLGDLQEAFNSTNQIWSVAWIADAIIFLYESPV